MAKKSKLKIYIVANSITDANSMSGGDKNFIELGKIWQKKGHKIVIVTIPEGKKMCLRAGLKTKFILLPDLNPQRFGVFFSYIYRLTTSILILRRLFLKNGPRVILSSSHYLTDLLPAFFLKIRHKNAKWGIFLHLIFPNPFKGYQYAYQPGWQIPKANQILNWLFQFLSFFLAKHSAQKIFCVNQEIEKYLLKRGFKKRKISSYPNGINHQFISQIADGKKMAFDCLFIGRFHPQKGLNDLVKIWQEVVKVLPQTKLGIIGSGPKKITQSLKNDIKTAKLGKKIIILGFKDGVEKFKILKASKILIFPSYYESFGIVPLEAQACGKPVVAYSLPPVKAIFKKGVLFASVGKTQQFAQLAVRLLADKALYQKTAKDAQTHSQKFSWQKSAQLVLQSFQDEKKK